MGRRAGPPQVRRHGATWWARFTVPGRGRTEVNLELPASRPQREAEAKAEEVRAHAVIAAGLPPPPVDLRERALDVLIYRYLDSTRALGRDARYTNEQEIHFKAHFLRCDEDGQPTRWTTLDDITATAIATYQVERIAAGRSTVTLYKELVTLSRFLKWAKREGLIDSIPEFERPRQTSSYSPPNLTPAQVQRLIKALAPEVRPWALFTWAMALRFTESMSIEWRDIDRKAGTLTVRAEIDKAGRTWRLPLADEAKKVLAGLDEGGLGDRLFRLTRDQRNSIGVVAARLGLPHVTPHHLRHFRLTELGHTTRDVGSLQYFARHTSLQTTSRYVHGRTEAAATMLSESKRRR